MPISTYDIVQCFPGAIVHVFTLERGKHHLSVAQAQLTYLIPILLPDIGANLTTSITVSNPEKSSPIFFVGQVSSIVDSFASPC